jgi:hypothetical protein
MYNNRHAEGITVGPNGILYISEHGDKSDHEINALRAGGTTVGPK